MYVMSHAEGISKALSGHSGATGIAIVYKTVILTLKVT